LRSASEPESFVYFLLILRVRLLFKLLCGLLDASADITALYRLRYLLYVPPRRGRTDLYGTDNHRMARLASYWVIQLALFSFRHFTPLHPTAAATSPPSVVSVAPVDL
jgi:hypothetical protein